jgi:hypothetical protein
VKRFARRYEYDRPACTYLCLCAAHSDQMPPRSHGRRPGQGQPPKHQDHRLTPAAAMAPLFTRLPICRRPRARMCARGRKRRRGGEPGAARPTPFRYRSSWPGRQTRRTQSSWRSRPGRRTCTGVAVASGHRPPWTSPVTRIMELPRRQVRGCSAFI